MRTKRPAVVVTFDELPDEVVVCREQGHRWSRLFKREWTRRKPHSGPIIEEKRIWDCEDCGSERIKVFEISGGRWYVKSTTINYPKDKPYLLKGHGGRMDRAEMMALAFRRAFPKEKLG